MGRGRQAALYCGVSTGRESSNCPGILPLAMSNEETAPPAVHFSRFLLELQKMDFTSPQAGMYVQRSGLCFRPLDLSLGEVGYFRLELN